MTPIESGDPRLTAYVLGELSASEALAVEAWLIKSPETRSEVQGIRGMVELLRVGFSNELSASLAAPAKMETAPALTVVRPGRRPQPRRAWFARAGLAAAAVIALGLMSSRWFFPAPTGTGTDSLAMISADLPPYLGSVPGADGSTSLGAGDGLFLTSTSGEMPSSARTFGADPVITEVRFLSGDPSELRNFPLTPEMVSYLPVSSPSASARPHGSGLGAAVNGPFYLDAERYPNPKIAPTRAVNEWEEARIMSSLSASIAIGQEPAAGTPKSARLLDAGRQLFLAGEFEAATVVLEKAIGELPESVSGADPLREQVEALLNASRNMQANLGR